MKEQQDTKQNLFEEKWSIKRNIAQKKHRGKREIVEKYRKKYNNNDITHFRGKVMHAVPLCVAWSFTRLECSSKVLKWYNRCTKKEPSKKIVTKEIKKYTVEKDKIVSFESVCKKESNESDEMNKNIKKTMNKIVDRAR